MATLDPSIIYRASQPADILGAMQTGNALAQQATEQRRATALAEYTRANGAGIMSGDQNALAGLFQYSPELATNIHTAQQNNARAEAQLDMQRERYGVQDAQWERQFGFNQQQAQAQASRQAQVDQRADEEWRWKLDEHARGLSQAEREAQAAEVEKGVKMGMAARNAQEWDEIMQVVEPSLVGMFDQRDMVAARFMDIADILAGRKGPEFRPATADEAAKYGAQAGQFGPDNRFYPNNPPQGMSIESDGQGGFRMVQGAGVGGGERPLTESQAKDNVYATRAEGALAVLDPIADNLSSFGQRAASADPTGVIRGKVQTPDFQLAQNAGDEFLQAILRKDTGAAITEQEQALYGVTYLPQPGDSPEVRAQKKQARRRALEALKSSMSPAQIIAQERALQASGSATLEPVQQQGGGIQPGAVEDGYRFKGGDPADPNSWEQVK